MTKILTSIQMKEWDEYTIKNEGIKSIELMERASKAFVNWFLPRYNNTQSVHIICGPGNNGGDGFAIARLLVERNYLVNVFEFGIYNRSEDCKINRKKLAPLIEINTLATVDDLQNLGTSDVVIDAIFGTGLTRPLEGIVLETISHLNKIEARKISVDIATGLFTDEFNPHAIAFQPDFTVTFQSPKLAFLLAQNHMFVGDFHVVDIGLHSSFLEQVASDKLYLDSKIIRPLVKLRSKFAHKGNFGKSLIIGGSYGMIGAVVLCAKACFRTGAGLVRLYLPKCGYSIAQTLFPEATVETDKDRNAITNAPSLEGINAIAIGPGLSETEDTEKVILEIFKNASTPLVLDAGALNLISRNSELLENIPRNSILTPHPKEFERLFGKFDSDYARLTAIQRIAEERSIYIILKGAHTTIACPDGYLYFNSTGNPGMAKGGSGDVLTGIICGLLSQGYTAKEASLVGVFMHGYAGDKAVAKSNLNSIIASDIIENISDFYNDHK